jgi:hypothetical protein
VTLEPDLHWQMVITQQGDEALEVLERIGDRQLPPARLAGNGDQHLMAVLGNVDAYQNTGIRSMLNLGHGVLRTLCGVVRKTTLEI